MYLIVVIVALLVVIYSGVVVIDCAHRQPLSRMHKERIDRRQAIHTVVLVVAALVLGLSLENVL